MAQQIEARLSEVAEAISETLDEIREEPCAECGSAGETMPCIVCDKLVCDECGVGTRWCKSHAPAPPA